MKCPFCGDQESKVVDSRHSEDGLSIRRRRECIACQRRFTTYEIVESLPIMDAFDPASLLPEMEGVLNVLTVAVRVATLVGPIVLLMLGLGYLIFAPKEANYIFGYRCAFGMGSVEAWRFTQRLAGIIWSALGLVLSIAMVLLTGKFGQLNAYDVVWAGAKYILWEVGLVAASSLFINTVVMMQFTYDGELRRDRR